MIIEETWELNSRRITLLFSHCSWQHSSHLLTSLIPHKTFHSLTNSHNLSHNLPLGLIKSKRKFSGQFAQVSRWCLHHTLHVVGHAVSGTPGIPFYTCPPLRLICNTCVFSQYSVVICNNASSNRAHMMCLLLSISQVIYENYGY